MSTPVVEVGIDNPGATIMIIEGGRISDWLNSTNFGAGLDARARQSYCFLYSENLSEKENNQEA